MRDCDDPLRPVAELGVRHDQRDDDGEDDERAAHHVDDERLLEVLLVVGGADVVEAGQRRALVEGAVEQVRHPLVVGQAAELVEVWRFAWVMQELDLGEWVGMVGKSAKNK